MGDVYGTAFKLLTLDFSVIPSGGGDKHKAPLVNWRDYQTTAPDESQLQAWECELNPVLWGIVANDRVAVIDADTPDTRAALEAELGEPHVVTPRGGAHWYIDTALRNVPHEVPPDIRLSLSTVCKLFTRVILLPTKLILHMVIDREV